MKKINLDKIGQSIVTDLRKRIVAEKLIDSGNLYKSILYRVQNNLIEIDGADYIMAVDKGTKPHSAPVDKLTPWAVNHNISPWALWYSIKEKGTKAHPFLNDFLLGIDDNVWDVVDDFMDINLNNIFK
jgi:hypothetical protein